MSEMSDVASELLRESGELCSFSYQTPDVFDPDTGAVTIPGSKLTAEGYGYTEQYKLEEADGTVIKTSDIKLIVELLATRPQVGWICVVDNKTYRVMDCLPIREAGEDVCYTVQLR